jgi:exosortase A
MRHTVPIRAKQTQTADIARLALGSPAEPAPLDSAVTPAGRTGLASWSSNWSQSLLVFAGCSVLLIWLFRADVGAVIKVWSTSLTFGHGFFIFPVTIFLFYRLRRQLAESQPKPAAWALPLIAGALLIWMVGELVDLAVVRQFAFVSIWQLLFLLVFGWQVARASIFPLAYLYAAVPFGTSAIPTLQYITANLSVAFLRLSGVPVFLDGFHIEIPSGNFLIAEACSGVRYLIVCLAVGVLAAHLFFRSWPRRIIFVAVSFVMPIIVNGVRAYTMVMFGHYGRYDLATGFDHLVAGFIFMSTVLLCLLGAGVLLRDAPAVPAASDRPAPDPTHGTSPVAVRERAVQLGTAVLAMTVIFWAHMWSAQAKAPLANLEVALQAPTLGSDWVFEDGTPRWSPSFRGADAELHQGYRYGKDRVDLYLAYYAYQREGAEAINDQNAIASIGKIKVFRSRQVTLQFDDLVVPANELVLLVDGKQRVALTWYWIGGENTNSRLMGKLQEFKALVAGGERAAAFIALSADVTDSVEQTADLLNTFMAESFGRNGALFKVDAGTGAAQSTEGAIAP